MRRNLLLTRMMLHHMLLLLLRMWIIVIHSILIGTMSILVLMMMASGRGEMNWNHNRNNCTGWNAFGHSKRHSMNKHSIPRP